MKKMNDISMIIFLEDFARKAQSKIMCFFNVCLLTLIPYIASGAQVTFNLTLQTNTPEGEVVCLQGLVGFPSWNLGHADNYPMQKISDYEWRVTLDIFSTGQNIFYWYVRNYNMEEEWEDRDNWFRKGTRQITISSETMTVQDTVRKWRWWPVDGVVPAIDTSEYLTAPPAFLQNRIFQRGVCFPDMWNNNFRPVVAPTLDKIGERCKANWIIYYLIIALTQADPVPVMTTDGFVCTPDSDLIHIITEAHRRGLKVFIWPQPTPWEVQSPCGPTVFWCENGQNWWEAFYKQWYPIEMHYAEIAEKYEVEMFGVSMAFNPAESTIIDPLAISFTDQIRSRYSGLLAMEYSLSYPVMQVYEKADYLMDKLWDVSLETSTLSNPITPSVSELLPELKKKLDDYYNGTTGRYGKPFILHQIAASSYDGSVLGNPDAEKMSSYNPDDPNVPLNLQVQANVYEAMLQALAECNWIAGAYSFAYTYWDEISKDCAIRGKPTEKILARWYDWLSEDQLRSRPIISGFSPSAGTQGSVIVITGGNLSGTTEVLFNDISAEYKVISDTLITAVVPAGSSRGFLKVMTPAGGAVSAGKFEINLANDIQPYLLAFNGHSSLFAGSNAIFNLRHDFTMEAWVFVDSLAGNGQIAGLQYGEWPTNMSYTLFLANQGGITFNFSQHNQQTDEWAMIGRGILDGLQRWVHLAGVWKNDSLYFFIDGLETERKAGIGRPPDLEASFYTGGSGLYGKVRQVRLWNRALTAAEIRSFSVQQPTGSEDGLVAWWPLDDGSGQIARNLGPNKISMKLGASTEVDDQDPEWLAVSNQGEIDLKAPQGGESFEAGSTCYIIWTSQAVDSVKIELSTNNGLSWSVIAPSVKASTGNYAWKVRRNVSDQCLIRVTSLADISVTDHSAVVFSIQWHGPGDINNDSKIDIFDLLELLKILGGISSATPKADLNSDGKIDIFDLITLLGILTS